MAGNRFLNFIFIICLFSIIGCEIVNPEEEIPGYIKISNINLQTTSAEGSASHRILDAWVYTGNNPQGVYEMPVTFPIIKYQGPTRVQVFAGVYQNGISASRIIYPFYSSIDTMLDLQPSISYDLSGVIRYKTGTEFKLNENFEDAGIKFQKSGQTDTSLIQINSPGDVFEGNFSGLAILDSAKLKFEVATIDAFNLPKGGRPVYLEINYKNDIIFTVGMYASTPTQVIDLPTELIINPSPTEWKKMYIDLTSVVSSAINAFEYRLYIRAIKTDENSTALLYFDNIKLIHN